MSRGPEKNIKLKKKICCHGNNFLPEFHLKNRARLPLFIYFFFCYFTSRSTARVIFGRGSFTGWRKPVHTSWCVSTFCTVNRRASASNYQLSNMKCTGRDSNRRPQRLKASTLTATPPSPHPPHSVIWKFDGVAALTPSKPHPQPPRFKPVTSEVEGEHSNHYTTEPPPPPLPSSGKCNLKAWQLCSLLPLSNPTPNPQDSNWRPQRLKASTLTAAPSSQHPPHPTPAPTTQLLTQLADVGTSAQTGRLWPWVPRGSGIWRTSQGRVRQTPWDGGGCWNPRHGTLFKKSIHGPVNKQATQIQTKTKKKVNKITNNLKINIDHMYRQNFFSFFFSVGVGGRGGERRFNIWIFPNFQDQTVKKGTLLY